MHVSNVAKTTSSPSFHNLVSIPNVANRTISNLTNRISTNFRNFISLPSVANHTITKLLQSCFLCRMCCETAPSPSFCNLVFNTECCKPHHHQASTILIPYRMLQTASSPSLRLPGTAQVRPQGATIHYSIVGQSHFGTDNIFGRLQWSLPKVPERHSSP
jgi:hypothetical protein